MQKLYSLFVVGLLFLTSFGVSAQTYVIDTSNLNFESKPRECLSSVIDPKSKAIKKAFKRYMKKSYGIKMKGVGFLTNKDVLKAKDVMCGTISAKRMNIYCQVIQTPKNSQMSFFGSFGYDIFIENTAYPAEFKQMRIIMNSFLMQYLNEYYSEEIQSTATNIKTLNYNKTKLSKNIAHYDRRMARIERRLNRRKQQNITDEKAKINNNDKIGTLTGRTIKLTSKKQRANVNLQIIDDKLPKLNISLNDLMIKQKDLSKVAL